jgi:hypothetical protein
VVELAGRADPGVKERRMAGFHKLEGAVIVAGWTLLFVWGLVLLIRKREAGRWYWRLVATLQVLLGVQLLAGIVLFAMGGRPPILHYFYGAVFPAALLLGCHVFTRGLTKGPYHIFFTWGAFFIAALTGRALMTGLGLR